MKVRELRHVLAEADAEALVLLASDSEGNRFSPLAAVSVGRYRLTFPWSAELLGGRGETDRGLDGLVLWPTR